MNYPSIYRQRAIYLILRVIINTASLRRILFKISSMDFHTSALIYNRCIRKHTIENFHIPQPIMNSPYNCSSIYLNLTTLA